MEAYLNSKDNQVDFSSLSEMIFHIAKNTQVNKNGIIFIDDDGSETFETYSSLYENAKIILCALQKKGLKKGSFIILQIENPLYFLRLFWACILGGIIAVPLSIPISDSPNTEAFKKLLNVSKQLSFPFIVTEQFVIESFEEAYKNNSLRYFSYDILAQELSNDCQIANINENDIAYVQYSSGSTGDPKGVIITHKNLMNNLAQINHRLKIRNDDLSGSWMPLTHDMGLVAFHLTPVFSAITHFILSPNIFIKKPQLFLDKIDKLGATVTVSPNFGLLWMIEKVKNEQLKNIDLSKIRIIISGAEPISMETVRGFYKKFSKCGLKQGTIYQVYGMAEACVGVSLPEEEKNESVFINRHYNKIGSNVQYISRNDQNAAEIAAVGKPLDGIEIKIIDDNDKILSESQIGNIVIKGPNIFNGHLAEKDSPFTSDGFFYTGDLGFINDGKLFVTGRKKDVIFVNGQNYYSSDLENILGSILSSNNKTAVCAYFNQQTSKDEIVIFIRYIKKNKDFLDIYKRVREIIFEKTGIAVDYIIPVPNIPTTTSGKPQRYKLLNQFVNHVYDDIINEINVYIASSTENRIEKTIDPTISNKVFEIAKKSFELDHIRLQDNFLNMGINSICLIKFLDDINNEYKVNIPMVLIMQNPTIGEFCSLISQKTKESKLSTKTFSDYKGDRKKLDSPFGLTEVQEAYLIGRQNSFEIGGISTHAYYEIKTELDIQRFNEALNCVIKRQPMLRAVINKNKTQQILSHVPYYQIHIEDLSHLSAEEQNSYILKQREQMSHNVLQYDKWPLFEFKAFTITEHQHYLFLGIDLLIADGSSMLILIEEVMKYYRHPDLQQSELEFSFCDYIQALNQFKSSPTYKLDYEYWHSKVDTFPAAPQIPLKCDPESIGKPTFKRLEKVYSADCWHSIKELAKEKSITPSVLLCTIYAMVLCKWSNQSNLAINITVFNRYPFHPDVEKIIGDFTSILLIDVDLSVSTDFWKIAEQIQKKFFEALDHRCYNGVSFIREIAQSKGLSGRAVMPFVFTSMLFGDTYGNTSDGIDSWGNLEYGISQTPQVYLDFQVMERENQIAISWDYVSDLFDETMITDMFQAYCFVLEHIDKSNGQVPLPIADKKLIDDYNSTNKTVNSHLLHELIDEQCKKTPDAIAVKLGSEKISYSELENHSNQIARYLIKQGFSRGENIGVLVHRKIETIVNIVAVLKAGCSYVPVSPEYPKDRIDYILEHSSCKALLEYSLYDEKNISEYDNSSIDNVNHPDDPAYIIYTSGSTGNPKGVIITHLAAINTITDINEKFEIGINDKIIGLSSMCFDLSVYDIFGALTSGAQLVLIPDLLDVDNINRVVNEEGITVWNSVPAVMDMLIESCTDSSNETSYWNADQQTRINMSFNDTLRLVMLSGDWIPLKLPEKIGEHFPCAKIVSLGGATEASIWSIYFPIDTVDTSWNSIPYGYPLANQKIYVLDSFLEKCPVGVQGEIYIGGLGVALGYLNDTTKTASAFINHPKLGYIYKTGDYGILSRKGYIEFLGRKDDQVKIRGHRIELGEIENCMVNIPEIKNAVVTVCTDSHGQKYLCGNFVSNAKLEKTYIQDYLTTKLPNYMIPSVFVQLKEIPLSPNGKVDRKNIPMPETVSEDENIGIEPRNEKEKRMASIWKSVLNISKVYIDDNFFELGGDSFKCAMLISKIHKEFKADIPLRDVFQNPTIRKMSPYVKLDEEDIFSSIKPIEKKEYYDVSASQRRMYVLNQIDSQSTNYNTPGVVEIKGNLDYNRVQKVVKQLINRHESFRTSFTLVNGELVQKVEDEVNAEIEFWQVDEVDTDQKIKTIIKNFIRPFDLSRAPMFRIVFIKTINRTFLGFDTHHIISDGISKELLIKEFAELYSGQILPKLKIQYKDYAAWQNEIFFKSTQFAKQEKYWIDRFKDNVPTLNLPTDYKRPSIQNFDGNRIYFHFDKNVIQTINTLRKETNVTLYMVLLAALDIVLAQYSNQDDIIVGTPVAGRKLADFYNIVGNFINTLVISNHIDHNQTFRMFLDCVKKNTLEAFENQDYPFEKLVEKINIQRDTSRTPIFDVLFSLQNMDKSIVEVNNLEVIPYEIENKVSKFDISFIIYESEDELKLEVEFCTKLFKEESIRRLIFAYEKVLKQSLQNLDLPLKNIEVISKTEKLQILNDFNNTDVIYDKTSTIADIFEAQVKKTPDAVALTFSGTSLSYGELNKRSNQLARLLRQKGISRDCVVGVLADRSIEMIIGIIAILKAGGGFLPIDPSFPKSRINYMLKNCRSEIVLTQEKYKDILQREVTAIDLTDNNIYIGESSDLTCIQRKQSDLAYLIYTSGSTGLPKGVIIDNKALCNFLIGVSQRIDINEGRKILALTSISFDIFNLETIIPLCRGMEVVFADEDVQKDPKRIRQIIAEQHIDMLQVTPTRMRMILCDSKKEEFLSVKTLMVGGEALPESLLREIKEKFSCKIYNMYGPTETTIWSCIGNVSDCDRVHIGTPIANTKIYILNQFGQICPIGVPGELCIGGDGLAREYFNNPDLTNEKFVNCIYTPQNRIYRTGDLAKWLPDGKIEYLGRLDYQVKIRGYRIEIEEIENQMLEIDGVKESAVIVRENKWNEKNLYAYFVSERPLSAYYLRKELQKILPFYMIPSHFIQLENMPMTQNGKISRKDLPEYEERKTDRYRDDQKYSWLEEKIVNAWKNVLDIKTVNVNDNFFDLGGNSLDIVRLSSILSKELNQEIEVMALFQHPNISSFIKFLTDKNDAADQTSSMQKISTLQLPNNDIAIIGMSGRFPKSQNLEEFWENLRDGNECITFFTDEELVNSGVEPELLKNHKYIKAASLLQGVEYFDADFFGISHADAELMDPQTRIFIEVAWESLEDAGYIPDECNEKIGLFAGASNNFYWQYLTFMQSLSSPAKIFNAMQLNDKQFMPTMVSYKLNLKGPSVYLNTACSTGLVAIHMACMSLMNGECDMALAGSVNITQAKKEGYLYEDGMILSNDGHCRAFDENASGTIFGNGVGVVVLKPLENAIQDRDQIYAVIKGSAINNDGREKVGYAAPSITGQCDVIKHAMSKAKVSPESISYIETHGTGTPLGDQIEIEGLKLAYSDVKKQSCAIGSVKSNIGHLDVAAGIAGFIKTTLAIKHHALPASLHICHENHRLLESPFYVNTKLKAWKRTSTPLRAGISSFGIGGTNAHVIIEEAPKIKHNNYHFSYNIINLSARTLNGLKLAKKHLTEYLSKNKSLRLEDVSYTLSVGRKQFKYRNSFVCHNLQQAVEKLSETNKAIEIGDVKKSIVFMFPGNGSQYISMGKELYENIESFRNDMDMCFTTAKNAVDCDVKAVLFENGEAVIDESEITQVVLYILEYCLAKLLMSWGIMPDYMIGHSIGEYVAATLAGVFSLEDGISLIAVRSKLIQNMPKCVMLSKMGNKQESDLLANDGMSIDTINSKNMCTLSGEEKGINEIKKILYDKSDFCARIKTSSAYHSEMLRDVAEKYFTCLKKVNFHKPNKKYYSNLTGYLVKDDEATNPEYWIEQMLNTVQFDKAISEILKNPQTVLLEVGPGNVLSNLVKTNKSYSSNHIAINVMKPSYYKRHEYRFLLESLSTLWENGVSIDWQAYYRGLDVRKVSLPTYPFERKKYWFYAKKFNLGNPLSINLKNVSNTENATVPIKTENTEDIVEKITNDRPQLCTGIKSQPTPTEKALVQIMESLFLIKPIGINDNFYDLGGDSLKYIMLRTSIQKEMHVDITIDELLKRQTIREIAQYIDTMDDDASLDTQYSIKPIENQDYYEVSPTQERIFLADRIRGGDISYNLPNALEITGNLDFEKIQTVIRKLIVRHEAFRTSFVMYNEKVVQKIKDSVNFHLPYQDISNGTQKKRIIDQIAEDFIKPFDLSKAPLFRAKLLRTGEREFILLFDMHHIIADGTSIKIILDDFIKLYCEQELSPLNIQLKDFIAWKMSGVSDNNFEKQEKYWLKEFDGDIPVLNLPTDYQRPEKISLRGDRIYSKINDQMKKGINEVAHSANTTPYMVLLTIYYVLLSKYSGQDDIVIGVAFADRLHAEIQNVVGMLVNTLPLHNHLDAQETFFSFLKRVKSNAIKAYKNQDYPLEQLINKLQVKRSRNRNPLFDIMFTQQVKQIDFSKIRDLSIKPYQIKNKSSMFDMTMFVNLYGNEIELELEYSTDLFKKTYAEKMLDDYKNLISSCIENPDVKIKDINLGVNLRDLKVTAKDIDFNLNL